MKNKITKSAPPSNPEYSDWITFMLGIEPVYQFQKLIDRADGNELRDFIKGYLMTSAEVALGAKNTTTGNYLHLLDWFIVEKFLRIVYNKKSTVPDRIKRHIPPGVIRALRNEADPIANLWVACWHSLEALYIHNKIPQHPAHMMFVLLIESRITGLLSVYCTLPDGVTVGQYIAYQQGINAYINNLDASPDTNPIDPGLVATCRFLAAMRAFAEESDVFRKNQYSKFKTARSKMIGTLKTSKPGIAYLTKYNPIKNHFAG